MVADTGHGRPRSAVLVHGTWSGPYDWRWVTPRLEQAGLRVVAVDLPSHSSADAGLDEDAAVVKAAIRACEPPVVVAAWSAGSESMEVATGGEAGVARLVYVASYPTPPGGEGPEPLDWIDDNPMIQRLDGTFVLDTDLWLEAESHLFDATVLAHLREHRRRPVSLRVLTEPIPGGTWRIPFTVLLGRSDRLIPADEIAREVTELTTEMLHRPPDIRFVDSDHFMLFRVPETIADLILEPLPA